MRPLPSISDRLLYWQVASVAGARDVVRRLRHRLRRLGSDERGQTPTEYLMIVGLMAAIIVVVFTLFYWPQVKEAANLWVAKVRTSILGEAITE